MTLKFAPPAETRRHIERVMDAHPTLTKNGFGFGNLAAPEDYDRRFRKSREEMRTDESCREFESARAWLEQCPRRKSISRQQSSYGLKHEVEAWMSAVHPGEIPYVSNGMFTAAAIHLGFDFRKGRAGKDDPNVYLNISAKGRPRG